MSSSAQQEHVQEDERYERIRILGSGAFGTVHLARCVDPSMPDFYEELVAVKAVPLDALNDSERSMAMSEAAILKNLQHENVLAYVDCFIDAESHLCLVTEFVDGGDLANLIRRAADTSTFLDPFVVSDVARQLLEGLSYLHSNSVVHRDLKPANIYITKSGTIKIGDFGVSKLLSDAAPHTATFIGTPFYICPELCMGEHYSYGADVWALGVLLYELYCLKLPFQAGNVLALINVVSEGKYDVDSLEHRPMNMASSTTNPGGVGGASTSTTTGNSGQHQSTTQFNGEVQNTFYPAASSAAGSHDDGGAFFMKSRGLATLVAALVKSILIVQPDERPSAAQLLLDFFGVSTAAPGLRVVSELAGQTGLGGDVKKANDDGDHRTSIAGGSHKPAAELQQQEQFNLSYQDNLLQGEDENTIVATESKEPADAGGVDLPWANNAALLSSWQLGGAGGGVVGSHHPDAVGSSSVGRPPQLQLQASALQQRPSLAEVVLVNEPSASGGGGGGWTPRVVGGAGGADAAHNQSIFKSASSSFAPSPVVHYHQQQQQHEQEAVGTGQATIDQQQPQPSTTPGFGLVCAQASPTSVFHDPVALGRLLREKALQFHRRRHAIHAKQRQEIAERKRLEVERGKVNQEKREVQQTLTFMEQSALRAPHPSSSQAQAQQAPTHVMTASGLIPPPPADVVPPPQTLIGNNPQHVPPTTTTSSAGGLQQLSTHQLGEAGGGGLGGTGGSAHLLMLSSEELQDVQRQQQQLSPMKNLMLRSCPNLLTSVRAVAAAIVAEEEAARTRAEEEDTTNFESHLQDGGGGVPSSSSYSVGGALLLPGTIRGGATMVADEKQQKLIVELVVTRTQEVFPVKVKLASTFKRVTKKISRVLLGKTTVLDDWKARVVADAHVQHQRGADMLGVDVSELADLDEADVCWDAIGEELVTRPKKLLLTYLDKEGDSVHVESSRDWKYVVQQHTAGAGGGRNATSAASSQALSLRCNL